MTTEETPGQRLYRTGDLALYQADGNILFLVRIDYQVKIRGYRIELGDIEASLAGHELVREAVVTDHEDPNGNKMLVAYVVLDDPHGVATEENIQTLNSTDDL